MQMVVSRQASTVGPRSWIKLERFFGALYALIRVGTRCKPAKELPRGSELSNLTN